ncbi:Vps54-like protein [Ophiocordyceps sinensis CO18]|uniref:Vps54-like protein n=1 Tax=Ophiocordyceps sinensis (strain Co18 / CGMCC 3.14243) TaxID=911162 RepID=T5AMU1_OPHSC|nr:Vps54-like protein [Ophiocordyceps sinensis CO18]
MTAPASSAHRPPTARDIPPVTLTNIPHVDNEEFTPYLTQVGLLYEQLRRVKEENEEEASSYRRGARHDGQPEGGVDGHLRPASKSFSNRRGSTASLASLSSIEVSSPARRYNKAYQGPPPLSTIPNVYFDEDFHLENPRTFDVVSERSEVIRTPKSGHGNKGEGNGTVTAPRKALATNAILQEKLSWYMDTIEVHLINSISTASTTFFSALGSLKELHLEAADSVERISALRKELEALDVEVATNGLQIVEKRGRQENLRKLHGAVWQLRQIVDGVAGCESLVEAGEVDKALASIDSLERLIAGECEQPEDGEDGAPVQLRDLRSASALQGVNDDLSTLRFRAGKAFESQFSAILLADLRHHVESVSKSDVLLRWSHAASRSRGGHFRTLSVHPTYLSATEELKAKLLPSMAGLHGAKHVAIAAMAYREAVLREIRNLIRRPLPSSNDDDNESMVSVSTASGGKQRSTQEKSASLARNLRALGPEDAEELLVAIYIGVTETLRRLTTQVKVLLDIASSLTQLEAGDGLNSPPTMSPVTSPRPDRHGGKQLGSGFALQEELHKALDEATLLTQAVDVSNDKIVKVLKVRSEQATHFPQALFLRYFTLNLYFANECEAISSRSGTSLKTVVNGQIKEFVQRNRDAEMQKLAQGMESDQWNAKDFTERNSKLLGLILESSTHDDAAWTDGNEIWVPYQAKDDSTTSEPNGTGKDKTRPAIVDSEKFVLPNSAVLCLEGIGNFLHVVAGIPSMTTDVASSLVAYLQLFNSRCTQLILGAGATRSAGLRNITTKHLALASQALAFIATIVPHVREFVRRHAGSGAGASSLMGEFDKVRRLLQEHQESIHQKLVDIMGGRAAIHAKSMKATDWSLTPSDGPHAYMETLTKETTTLHRVLTKHLPETSIHIIMQPVFASYKDQLGEALKEADPKTKAGQQSMLRDVDLLSAKLGKVEGFGDTGDFLADLVKAKEVKDETPTEADETPTEAEETPTEDEEGADAVEVEAKAGETRSTEEHEGEGS